MLKDMKQRDGVVIRPTPTSAWRQEERCTRPHPEPVGLLTNSDDFLECCHRLKRWRLCRHLGCSPLCSNKRLQDGKKKFVSRWARPLCRIFVLFIFLYLCQIFVLFYRFITNNNKLAGKPLSSCATSCHLWPLQITLVWWKLEIVFFYFIRSLSCSIASFLLLA